MNEVSAVVALNAVTGLGSARIEALLAHFGQADNVFKASALELQATGILPQAVVHNLVAFAKDVFLEGEYALARQKGVTIIPFDDPAYPESLSSILGKPLVLYVRGDASLLSHPAIAMVGARAATFYGAKIAKDFAASFAKAGVTVISGLARGIDTASHLGALEAKGKTVAVIGCGLSHIYPKENAPLLERIVQEGGVVISEFPFAVAPQASNFPRRNRIISGLSRALVVVEAAMKSGSLITVDYALEQGKDIFVVPGPIDHRAYEGSNKLLKEGAKIALSSGDVLEGLGISLQEEMGFLRGDNTMKLSLTEQEYRVYSSLDSQPTHLEQLMARVSVGLGQLQGFILKLELLGLVRQLPGQYYVRNDDGKSTGNC